MNAAKTSMRAYLPLAWLLCALLWAVAADAKVATDFNPHCDFSKLKTFAYIGGVESLVRQQLNPALLNDRIHRAVVRELTAKGLREVTAEENPDLVVRYWVEASTNAMIASNLNWGIYGSYYGHYWTSMYYTMTTPVSHQGTIGIELIDAKTRDLVWRLFVTEKIVSSDADKVWKPADKGIKKAFENFPPSAKAVADKKAEWAKIDSAEKTTQP